MVRRFILFGLSVLMSLNGCMTESRSVHIATTQPGRATDIDPEQADPEFWYAQPAAYQTRQADFDQLWDKAEEVSRRLLFKIDRRDRRTGVLTTEPMISAQWFEPWRQELKTCNDVANSSIATYRRTIRYEFVKQGQTYSVTPKVLIERQSITERRVSGVLNRLYFRRDRELNASGNREADAGIFIPDTYWYSVGRDAALEAFLVRQIDSSL